MVSIRNRDRIEAFDGDGLHALFVTGTYPTPEYPARGLSVKPVADALRRAGARVTVHCFHSRSSRLNYLKGMARTFQLARPSDFDLVHAHYVYGGMVARCQFRLPLVVSFCGSDVMQPRTRWLCRLVANLADAVIVKSKRLAEILGHEPVHVIPNGVDMDLFQPIPQDEARAILGLALEKRYVFFIGSKTSPAKRFDRAQESWAVLQDTCACSDVELVGLYDRKVPHSQIPIYMNAADVLLLSSDWEGSPNVIKEAMGCNLPIVTTDVGDVREVIRGTEGCYITEKTPEAIAEGLCQALAFGQRTEGRESVKWLRDEEIAKRIISVYQKVAYGTCRMRR